MDGEDFQPPRHPDDRLWRHPAEFAWEASMSSQNPFLATGAQASEYSHQNAKHKGSGRSMLGTVVISSLFGASFALLTVFATGLGTRVEPAPLSQENIIDPGDSNVLAARSTLGVAEIATSVRSSVVQLRLGDDDDDLGDASAIVWNSDGYLVTDAQMVDSVEAVNVVLADGTTKKAAVIGVDPVTKLAVLHVNAPELTPADHKNTASVSVGDWAMAYGVSESGLPSISSGTISGVEERLSTQDGTLLYGMVRLGAALPDGVVGGPLVSAQGEVIGILLQGSGDSPFSWALPTTYAETVIDQLIETGSMTHPWLGVEGERRSGGPTITRITANSPASEAGLKVGDVLLRVDDEPLISMITLVTKIRSRLPGDTIVITYERDGEVETTEAVLAGH